MSVLLNYLGTYHYVIMEFETNPNEIKCTETIFRKPNYFVRRNMPRNKKNKATSHGRKNAHTQKKTL